MNQLVFLDPNCIDSEPFTTSKLGHVYIVDNGLGMVKIGRTINPERRIRAIETQTGIELKNTYVSPKCSNYESLEITAHKEFAKYRVKGEWFKVEFPKVKEFLSSCNFEMKIESKPIHEFKFYQNGIDSIRIESDILEKFSQKMQSIRDEVIISKAKYGFILDELRERVEKTVSLYDECVENIQKQISVLIDLGNEYSSIKMILEKKYLMSA